MASHSCSDLLSLQDLRLDAPVSLMEKRTSLPLLPPSSVPPQSPFLTLAPELKQAIFSKLPQPSSLKAVVLTCSDFYHTFLGAKSLILKSVLCNEIGPDLLHDAIFAWQAQSLKPFDIFTDKMTMKLLEAFVDHNFATTSLLQTWKIRDAVALSNLHDDVKTLCKDFASWALHTNMVTGQDDSSPSPLSVLESNRIRRAFYRHELFCNIFQKHKETPDIRGMSGRLMLSMTSIWAPWEYEQMECVQEYLFQCLLLPFNDIAEHDVEWGELKMISLDKGLQHNTWTTHYLTRGLSYLRRVFNAFTYDDRCRLLKPQKKECPEGKYLYGAMYPSIVKGLREVRNYKEDLRARFCTTPSFDGDRGPKEAWIWYWTGYPTLRHTNGGLHKKNLLGRAYVMWDYARLAKWGLLDCEWFLLPWRPIASWDDLHRHESEMRKSFKARHKIWKRGGRGWWSEEDESRVVWPPGGPIEKPKKKEIKTISQ